MKRILTVLILAGLGCTGETSEERAAAAAAREQALGVAAREAAAKPLEAQPTEVQARYREASRQAQELMRQHAKERLDALLQARRTLPQSAQGSQQALDLDRAIELARGHQQRVEKGRGVEPPKRAGRD